MESSKFKFISQCGNFENSSTNILTDGDIDFSYKNFLNIFENLEKWFKTKHIDSTDCLAVECENSVPSALFLLYLLEKGYNFLVIPKDLKSTKAVELSAFFHYQIIVEPIKEKKDIFKPFQWLNIILNNNYYANNTAAQRGKLYLKTSGSTGIPKMAVIPHKGLEGNARSTVERLLLNINDRIAIPVPIFHSFGLTTAFLSAISVGASIDLQKGANILRYLKREHEFQPNVLFTTPIFCETLIKGRREDKPYRLTVAAGDCFRGDIFNKYELLSGCLVNLYGSTEMGAIAAGSPNDTSQIRCQSVGKPMNGVQLSISDVEEIWCRNPCGFEGYIDDYGNKVDLGQDYEDGWFRIKDLGRLTPEGYLQVLGRSDHSVKRDGILIFFADIEKIMGNISGLEAVVIMSKGESKRGKKLIAFCVPAKSSDITLSIIKSNCFKILPKNSIPDQIFLIDSLPLMNNGKIDRQKLLAIL